MARRSYLARLARPLTVADPIVWSVPRASADEARPIAQAARPASAAPADPPAVPLQNESATAGRVRSGQPSLLSTSSPPPATPAPAPEIGATTPDAEATTQTIRTTARSLRAATAQLQSAPTRRPNPVRATERPAPDGRVSRAGPPDLEIAPPRSRTVVTVDAPTTSQTGPEPSFLGPADPPTATHPVGATETLDHLAAHAAESQPRAPRREAPMSRPSEREAHLHIGAIEIRVTRPPPPATTTSTPSIVQPPVSPAATTPLARAYASRFGLAQS